MGCDDLRNEWFHGKRTVWNSRDDDNFSDLILMFSSS